jgi:hypothetical protein
MLRIGLLLLTTGKKPALWCTPRQVLHAAQQSKKGDARADDHRDERGAEPDDDADDNDADNVAAQPMALDSVDANAAAQPMAIDSVDADAASLMSVAGNTTGLRAVSNV